MLAASPTVGGQAGEAEREEVREAGSGGKVPVPFRPSVIQFLAGRFHRRRKPRKLAKQKVATPHIVKLLGSGVGAVSAKPSTFPKILKVLLPLAGIMKDTLCSPLLKDILELPLIDRSKAGSPNAFPSRLNWIRAWAFSLTGPPCSVIRVTP